VNGSRFASLTGFPRAAGRALLASRAVWTLADQGAVSAGTFLVNIILARHLPASEYGVFAMLFSTGLMLQLFILCFVGYPLTVRLPSLFGDDAHRLSTSSIFVSAAICIPLCVLVSIVLVALNRADIVVPGCLWFFFWQLQQATRRTFMADQRYGQALIGDAISSLGQVLIVAVLATMHVSLFTTLFYMAIAPGLGAAVQMLQRPKTVALKSLHAPHRWLIEHAYLGGWTFVTGLLYAARGYAVFWALAVASGTEVVGALQAALNVFLLLNPIQLGLSNLVPQVTARAYVGGNKVAAWKAARPYILGGLPPTLLYLVCVVISPSLVLYVVYGGAAHFQGLGPLFPALAVYTFALIVTELVLYYFQGIQEVRIPAAINLVGFAATMILAMIFFPMVGPLEGAALAFAGADLIRLALTLTYLRRLLHGQRSAAAIGRSWR